MSHSIPKFWRRGSKFTGRACLYSAVALACVLSMPHFAFSADKPKGQEISRVIAKEITAAQKAMQASQWSRIAG